MESSHPWHCIPTNIVCNKNKYYDIFGKRKCPHIPFLPQIIDVFINNPKCSPMNEHRHYHTDKKKTDEFLNLYYDLKIIKSEQVVYPMTGTETMECRGCYEVCARTGLVK